MYEAYFKKWKFYQVSFEGLKYEYLGYVDTIYIWGLGCFFAKSPKETWDFFEYLAHDTWEYENAKGTFSHHILDFYEIHLKPLDESKFRNTLKPFYTPCAHVSCDYCYSSKQDVDSSPHVTSTNSRIDKIE